MVMRERETSKEDFLNEKFLKIVFFLDYLFVLKIEFSKMYPFFNGDFIVLNFQEFTLLGLNFVNNR